MNPSPTHPAAIAGDQARTPRPSASRSRGTKAGCALALLAAGACGLCAAAWAAPTGASASSGARVMWSAATLPAAAATLASAVEFVASRKPPTPRPEQGLLVLHLEALESADAALTLALQWRQRFGPEPALICWLDAPRREQAAEALATLLNDDARPCTRILLAR
jgi:hypothetical protein